MPARTGRSLTWTDTLDARYAKKKMPLYLTTFSALGVIYGDIGTSPLYVMNGIFPSSGPAPSKEDALGAISAIVWTLMLVPLIKYSLIALEFGTNEGEGGPFALFSQLYPREKPGQEMTIPTIHSDSIKSVHSTSIMSRPYVKRVVQGITLFATALILSDGILTPAVSVVSAVEGLIVAAPSVTSSVTGIAIAILVLLFLGQSFGTQRLAFAFAPVIFVWAALLAATGIYNITKYPGIFRAFDPSRAVMYFVRQKSITPLSGVLLCITGVEALFANLGQFTKNAIRISFATYMYPALTLAYLGQGARLIHDGDAVISNIFYNSIPGPTSGPLWWIVWTVGILATIVASQAMITASFSLIQQMVGLDSFPPVRIVHTSDTHQGQIYAPVINYLLMAGCIGVTAGFGTDSRLTNAYGFAVAGVLFMTTFLLTLCMINVKHLPIYVALVFLVGAGFIDALFFASTIQKVPKGAWFTLTLAGCIGIFLAGWTWAKGLENAFDATHRTSLSQLFPRHARESEKLAELQMASASADDKDLAATSVLPISPSISRQLDGDADRKVNFATEEKPTWQGQLDLATPHGLCALPRVGALTYFHHLGSGAGAPHSFTALVQQSLSLPRVVIFLSIRVVGAPHLMEEDKYLVDKVRTLEGFYVMTLRLGYRDPIDLRNIAGPTIRRISALERGSSPPGSNPEIEARIQEIERAALTMTHILPNYHVASKGTTFFKVPLLRKAADYVRAFLLEEVFRRVEQNFPETSTYHVDESKVLRMGVHAAI